MLAPTQAASSQCLLGRPCVVRLNFVRPPDPHSTGRPVAWSRRDKSHRVALTAVASESGALAWGPDPLEDLRLLLQEDLDGPVPFATVAGLAGQSEVAHAVGATPALGVDVLDLERHVRLAAIRACACHIEQVLPQLVAGERALLGRDAGDLGVLDLLEVELDQLLRRRGDRTEPKEPADPGEHVGDAAFEARREPTLPSRPVIEPRWAVARLAGAAASTEGRTVGERRLDRRAPCSISIAATTRPVSSWTMAKPVVFEPGSILIRCSPPGGMSPPDPEDDRRGIAGRSPPAPA